MGGIDLYMKAFELHSIQSRLRGESLLQLCWCRKKDQENSIKQAEVSSTMLVTLGLTYSNGTICDNMDSAVNHRQRYLVI